MMKRTLFAVLSLAIGAGAAAAGQAREQPNRFAVMDRNNDGVVTREEWRGSSRSFAVHDWNNDGVLSGDELRAGRRRSGTQEPFESADQEYEFTNWTEEGFRELDHDRDGRISREEWHFDPEGFRRADHDGDNVVSRSEFLGDDLAQDDDREDRFAWLDTNNDGRVSRGEWHGSSARFERLDGNRDGVLTRAEVGRGNEPPPDLFTSVDVNRDDVISRDEWHWSRASFTGRDTNNDGRLSREEFKASGAESRRSEAYQAGYQRGLTEGRAAGREDREVNKYWDLEGQRELESADSGYEPRLGSKDEYQAGYREGFRRGYREGWGPRG
jgi:Ca2+-binding EF-hand superfamily protein